MEIAVEAAEAIDIQVDAAVQRQQGREEQRRNRASHAHSGPRFKAYAEAGRFVPVFGCRVTDLHLILEGNEEFMAVLIDAIDVKKRTLFEIDNTPFSCLDAEVNTPTARGGQTLVRLKIRNLLTNAVFERTFKASVKFKEPDLQSVPASYLYSDSQGSHFLDQETFETLTLADEMMGNALDFLIGGTL